MKKAFILLLTLFSINLYATDYSFTIGNKQYKIVTTMKTWSDAAAYAVQDGGHLVEIGSQAEQDGIWAAFQNSGISTTYTTVNDGGGIAYIWIGATDKNIEGTWIWDGNNDGQGTNFYTGQGSWGANNGSAVNGAYYNWGGTNTTAGNNEPDDYGSGQDAAAIGLEAWPAAGMGNIAGEWNDIDKSNSLYFIIEYEDVGFNEIEKQDLDFRIYKNDYKLSISSNETIKSLAIYNAEGKIIFSNEINSSYCSINSNLNSGIYFIRSTFNNEAIKIKKIFIK